MAAVAWLVSLRQRTAVTVAIACLLPGCGSVDEQAPKPGDDFASVYSDNIWDCDCSCGGSVSRMLGCAPHDAVAAAEACPYVCWGSDCGSSLACNPDERTCSATGVGARRVQACRTVFISKFRATPAFFGDFTARVQDGATATLRGGDQVFTIGLSGRMAFDVSTSPPSAGAFFEMARLDLTAPGASAGGAEVRDASIVHVERFYGSFVTDTDFEVPKFSSEFVLWYMLDPDGPNGIAAPQRDVFLVPQPVPLTGHLDLARREVSLHVVLGSQMQPPVLDATFTASLE